MMIKFDLTLAVKTRTEYASGDDPLHPSLSSISVYFHVAIFVMETWWSQISSVSVTNPIFTPGGLSFVNCSRFNASCLLGITFY